MTFGRRLRAATTLVLALGLLATAPAGTSPAPSRAHSGRPFVPPPLPSSRKLELFARLAPLLVQLAPAAPRAADELLRDAGAERIAPQLRVWKLSGPHASATVERLRARRALRAVEADRTFSLPARAAWPPGDPLSSQQWWVPPVGANEATPPGPGVPVTDVDSGLDLSHPEFVARPNTAALNVQTTTGSEVEGHGTAVASVIGAPENGLGIAGVYPQAVLQSFDASRDGLLDHGLIINGVLAAAARGAGVINLSFGSTSRDFIFEEALAAAFGEGSLVVASAGNEFANGNPTVFPASYPHVLTVAATTEADRPAAFSSSSLAVDLAAPGQDIPVAVPLWLNASGYETADGTSFSAPLVSGATSWVWTVRPSLEVTQLFEIMRRSARDVWRAGWDKDTGFGVLDIPSALSFPAPAVDPQEPNDDVYLVKPNGLFREGASFVVGGGRRSTSFRGRLDATEDPEDVFRVSLPPHSRLRVQLSADARMNLQAWSRRTRTVYEKGAAKRRDLLSGAGPSRRPAITISNPTGNATVAYVDVYLARGVLDGSYALRAALSRYSPSSR